MIKITDSRAPKTIKRYSAKDLSGVEQGTVFELTQDKIPSNRLAYSDWSRSNVFVTTENGVVTFWQDDNGNSGIEFHTFAEMIDHEADLEGIRDEPEFIKSDLVVNINFTRN